MHNITIGLDYKDFQEITGFDKGPDIQTPVTYMPLSFAYSSSLPDSGGMTRFSGGLNMVFRGFITDSNEFAEKRYKARGNYMYLTAGAERYQKLPAGMNLFLKLDGQISDQPLIPNEQYTAGGMMSVRGYKVAEAFGDDAFHGQCEISGPDMGATLGARTKAQINPYAFYDFAWLSIKKPLPGQDRVTKLDGAGIGLRGSAFNYFYYEAALGIPLRSTERTKAGQERFHFKVGVQF
jgi:hemolysin activation/secretion protein